MASEPSESYICQFVRLILLWKGKFSCQTFPWKAEKFSNSTALHVFIFLGFFMGVKVKLKGLRKLFYGKNFKLVKV